MVRAVLIYGVVLALGAVALQWLEYQVWARAHASEVYIALIATGFMALGIWVGVRLFRVRPQEPGFEPNLRAQASLGITEREYEVLGLLAAGRSNKEIAGRLKLSPNTVKTHIARLFEKLEAGRRTQAIARARELGLIP